MRPSPVFPMMLAIAVLASSVPSSGEAPNRDYGVIKNQDSPHTKLKSVDLKDVRWTDGFWARRFAQTRDVTLPRLWELASDPQTGHAIQNLRIAAGMEKGQFKGTHWQDAWVYKWLESACYVYAVTADRQLDSRMDQIIAVIARAQQPDGYIASQTIARSWPRFQDPRHHERHRQLSRSKRHPAPSDSDYHDPLLCAEQSRGAGNDRLAACFMVTGN